MPTLNWLTREADLAAAAKVPFRPLREEPALSFGTGDEGLLVQGDNLDALKALLPFYAGRVKCIYIDPPYNTRSAFEHYDDNLEHAKWLGMIVPRLMLLREFLSEDGSIWVSIDDNEGHYLKVVMDEVFGRRNFVANVVWQKRYAPANDSTWLSDAHDHVLFYARKISSFSTNNIPRSAASLSVYKNPDNDPRGLWRSDNYTCAKNAAERPNLYYPIKQPVTGEMIWPKQTRVWAYSEERHSQHEREGLVYWGKDGRGRVPALKRFASSLKNEGIKPQTVWLTDEAGHNQEGRKEQLDLAEAQPFSTPKPERLIQRILHISTNPGDLVLDSFLGSGTTAAVAHKMGRRWIGVEMGDHARTHCALRLKKVIEGEQGGISKDTGWQGGGGFRFLMLGPAIYDADGRIADGVGFADLARHVWFNETRTPLDDTPTTPLLGLYAPPPPASADPDAPAPAAAPPRAVALLFNGILKDRSPQGGNVLTRVTLALIREHLPADFSGPLTVYAAASRLSPARLKAEGVSFRQTPYELNAGAR